MAICVIWLVILCCCRQLLSPYISFRVTQPEGHWPWTSWAPLVHHSPLPWCAFWHKVVGVPNKTGPTPVSRAPQHDPEWGWASKWVKVGLRVPGSVTTAWSFVSVHLHCPCCLELHHSPGNWPVLSAVPWGTLRFLPPIYPHDNRNSISITWTLVSSLWQTQSDPPESS